MSKILVGACSNPEFKRKTLVGNCNAPWFYYNILVWLQPSCMLFRILYSSGLGAAPLPAAQLHLLCWLGRQTVASTLSHAHGFQACPKPITAHKCGLLLAMAAIQQQ